MAVTITNGIIRENMEIKAKDSVHMTKAERQREILDYMKNHDKTVTIEQLKQLYQVTTETLRKDLIEMERAGVIYRVFGGAVLQEKIKEVPVLQRYQKHMDLKMEIAREATRLISDRDFIALDSGSTNLCFAMSFPEETQISVLTNSCDIARALCEKTQARILMTGGQLRARNMSMTGEVAEDVLHKYRVSKVFLTCAGVGLNYGVMDAHESESRVKKAMVQIASEKYLLADHTKFEGVTPITVCPLESLTAIITDSKIDREIVERYRQAGIRMIVAED